MENQNQNRLRPHPDERFSAPQHEFDLAAAAAELRGEFHPGQSGHRQRSLYKHGPFSISLFLFTPLARLPAHRAKGIVSIHVLKGRLEVSAEGQSHDLPAGRILLLASEVEHNLVAREESEMLLTIHLDPPHAP